MTETSTKVEHVDVLIVGAGISGIGACYHLTQQCPDKTFVALDAHPSFGGTWWTHRYPGARSDSDLFTFGYRFKPWPGKPIATSDEILTYLGEVIEENDLEQHIRYSHRVVSASWSTDHRLWTINAVRTDTGEELTFTAGFLWMCQGYYNHAQGYTPKWPGMDQFEGPIVHPQTWPGDIDLKGKRVVVIGSGATAATLIPAIADECEHVTMLQRSPTFFVSRPNTNELADTLRSLDVPEEWIHEIVRRQMIKMQDEMTRMALEYPDMARSFILEAIRPLLPEGYPVEEHFNARYRPWQQRIAVVPEGDFFKSIKAGKASVVTDEIDTFTTDGIKVKSGDTLHADVIITATGFDLSILGDVDFTIDGEPLAFHDTVTYRGVMFTGVPNLAYVFGYFRASWTLRADLIADLVCRLLNHMDDRGSTMVVPELRSDELGMDLGPWVDPDNFNPGYLMRSMHLMPKQGAHDPWRLLHEYAHEREVLPAADLEDGTLVFK
jgi:cation diffusion facilitator CzcD-associated flavoprotein CzcO